MYSSKNARGRALRLVIPLSVAALALAGCASGSGSPAASSGSTTKTVKIAAVIKGLDNPFFQYMQKGIEATSKSTKSTVTVQAAQDVNDTSGQADKLTTVIGQDYGCLIVNPISGTNLVQALATATDKTIVNIDSPIDSAAAKAANLKIATYIGTDNKAAGGKAGTFLTSKLAAGSEVAIIGGIAGDVTSAARISGFKASASGLKVDQEVAADWDREKALTAATTILQAHPNVKAFFAANDDMGLGIVKAIANAKLTGKVSVVSVDGNLESIKSIEASGLTATVAQYPYEIGALGVEACEAAANGKTVPTNIESPTALVTADNAAEAEKAFPAPFDPFTDPLK